MLQADVSVGCAVKAVPRHTRQAYSPSDEPWSWDVDHLVCTHHNLLPVYRLSRHVHEPDVHGQSWKV